MIRLSLGYFQYNHSPIFERRVVLLPKKNQNWYEYEYETWPTRDGCVTRLIPIRVQAFTTPGPMEDQSMLKQ